MKKTSILIAVMGLTMACGQQQASQRQSDEKSPELETTGEDSPQSQESMALAAYARSLRTETSAGNVSGSNPGSGAVDGGVSPDNKGGGNGGIAYDEFLHITYDLKAAIALYNALSVPETVVSPNVSKTDCGLTHYSRPKKIVYSGLNLPKK